MNVTMPSVPLLTGTAALALQAATAGLRGYPPSHPDSQLLALAEKFFVENALYEAAESGSPEQDAAYTAYWAAVRAMEAVPAAGLAGLMAKAKVIEAYQALTGAGAFEDLNSSLLDDCIRLAGGAA